MFWLLQILGTNISDTLKKVNPISTFLVFCIFILGVLLVIISWFYSNTLSENLSLQRDLRDCKETLAVTQQKLLNTEKANEDLFNTMNRYRLSSQHNADKLNKLEKQVNKIYTKHPKLLNKAVNDAQKKVNRCFEDISKGLETEECFQ